MCIIDADAYGFQDYSWASRILRYTGISAEIEGKRNRCKEEQMSHTSTDLACEYIKALEGGATGDALARFFAPDVVISEMPNRIAAGGSESNLAKALQAAERGQQLFKLQKYDIVNILGEGDKVALEINWLGITAIDFQNLPGNSEIRNHVAVFLYFRNGRIARQRHYDCFEPW
ncbi:MAG: nuclear transport factor 2 family protein [Acidobacteria bacterium]|nr:MAG: nuclear transport factor 2 family protein [Acidobacteriota bacterium]